MSAQQKKHPFDLKTQYGLGFSTQDDEIVVDFFCGGGGAGFVVTRCPINSKPVCQLPIFHPGMPRQRTPHADRYCDQRCKDCRDKQIANANAKGETFQAKVLEMRPDLTFTEWSIGWPLHFYVRQVQVPRLPVRRLSKRSRR